MALIMAYLLYFLPLDEPVLMTKADDHKALSITQALEDASQRSLERDVSLSVDASNTEPFIVADKNTQNERLFLSIDAPEVLQDSTTSTGEFYTDSFEYSEENEYLISQSSELEAGQFRVILNNYSSSEPLTIDNDVDSDNEQTVDLEQGQKRIILDSEGYQDITDAGSGDEPMVGDPYYLAPGQYRIILQ